MRINNNINALDAQRNLAITGVSLSKSIERLSSGLRINRAADDAAGLSISEKLRANVRGLAQAIRNAQDGISMIQTAEGALTEVHSMLQRMRELGVQAANDTLSDEDKGNIVTELMQLKAEMNNISTSTTFNGKHLLTGALATALDSSITASTGLVSGEVLGVTGGRATVASVDVSQAEPGRVFNLSSSSANTLTITDSLDLTRTQTITIRDLTANDTQDLDFSDLGIKLTVSTGSGETKTAAGIVTDLISGSASILATPAFVNATATSAAASSTSTIAIGGISTSVALAAFSAATAGSVTGAAITATSGSTTNTGSITINSTAITYNLGTSPAQTAGFVQAAIQAQSATTGVTAATTGGGSDQVVLTTTGTGSGASIVVAGSTLAATGFANGTTSGTDAVGSAALNAAAIVAAINANTTNVVTAATTGGGGYTLTQKTASSVDKVVITAPGAAATGLTVGSTANGTDGSSDNNNINTGTTSGPANLQVGAEANDYFTVAFARVDVSSQGLASLESALSSFRDNHSVVNAQGLITAVDASITSVNASRSNLGGRQNRLEHAIANLGVAHENLSASESRIRDADMAEEMVTFTKGQILQQAGTAILAQANQLPQSILSLLRQ
jgi:flagellin